MNQPSTESPMPNKLENEVLQDCIEILYNVFETNAKAHAYYTELVAMCNNGASEDEVYKRLKEITEAEYAKSI